MSQLSKGPAWPAEWMSARGIPLWGAADLRDMLTPQDETGRGFPIAISWAVPMNPRIMAGIQDGPNQAYADECERVNITGDTTAGSARRSASMDCLPKRVGAL